jgi:hypothetical protein
VSVVLGLVAVVAMPAGIEVAREAESVDLRDAWGAIPVAALAGICAILLARGARRRIERTIGRVGGQRLAIVGRTLGVLGLALAIAGGIALGVYELLVRIE